MNEPLALDGLPLGGVARLQTPHVSLPVVLVEGPPQCGYVLEPSALAEIRELQAPDESDLLAEMIKAYLADAPAHLLRMTDALACGDAAGLSSAAHALKSGAGYLGARELQQLCVQLEHLGHSGATEEWQALAEPLRITFERTRRALTQELAGT